MIGGGFCFFVFWGRVWGFLLVLGGDDGLFFFVNGCGVLRREVWRALCVQVVMGFTPYLHALVVVGCGLRWVAGNFLWLRFWVYYIVVGRGNVLSG